MSIIARWNVTRGTCVLCWRSSCLPLVEFVAAYIDVVAEYLR
jgi:hypothetical protein